jgi:hypothetical protein
MEAKVVVSVYEGSDGSKCSTYKVKFSYKILRNFLFFRIKSKI